MAKNEKCTTERSAPARAEKATKKKVPKAAAGKAAPAESEKVAGKKTPKASAGKKAAAGKMKTPKVSAPKITDWTKAPAYGEQYEALKAAVLAAGGELTPITLDRIADYMDFWCQKRMLAEDVRKRGPVVVDDRGRPSENRSISLGLQVSKQMLELYKAMGLSTEPERSTGGTGRAAREDDEDDEL